MHFFDVKLTGKGHLELLKKNYFLVGISAFLFFLFGFFIPHDFIRGDQIRWINEVIIPYEKGDLTFWKAISYEYENFSHSHVLTILGYIASFEYLNFSFSYNFYVGTIFYLISFFVVFKSNILSDNANEALLKFSIFTLGFIYFNFTFEMFQWSLVTFEMLTFSLAFIYFYFINKIIMTERYYHIVYILPLFFLFGHSPSIGAILTALVYTLMLSLKLPKYKALLFYQVLALFLAYGLGNLINWNGFSHTAVEVNEINPTLNFENSLRFIFGALSTSIININAMAINKIFILPIALLILVVSFFTIYTFIKEKMYVKNSAYPILFLGFALIGTLGVLASRSPTEDLAFSERYERYYIGFPIFIILTYIYHLKNNNYTNCFIRSKIMFLFVFFAFLAQLLSSVVYFKRLPQYSLKEESRIEDFRNYRVSEEYMKEPVCRKGLDCEKALSYLDEKQLSIFKRDKYEK